jgi:hypothetical protein
LREAADLPPLGPPSNMVIIPAHWGKQKREMLQKMMRFIEAEIEDEAVESKPDLKKKSRVK